MVRISEKNIKTLIEYIETSKVITLVTHYNPDGDAIGSTSGLCNYLKEKGKDVAIVLPNPYASSMQFLLDGLDYIVAEEHFKMAKKRLLASDLLIIMDMNATHRSGDNLQQVLDNLEIKKVMIDHHVKPESFDLVFSQPTASSTCELVYKILTKLEGKKVFSKAVSTSLFAGIKTDTGSFAYSCTEKDVYIVAANLIKSGINPVRIHQQIFDTYSHNRLSLLGYAISKKLRVYSKQRAAFIYLNKRELRRFHYEPGDLEGVVNYCLKLQGVDFCALLSERDNKIRMSFRSKTPDIDVNRFANKYWNGGGHVMAAGGKSFEAMEVVVAKLIEQIKAEVFLERD